MPNVTDQLIGRFASDYRVWWKTSHLAREHYGDLRMRSVLEFKEQSTRLDYDGERRFRHQGRTASVRRSPTSDRSRDRA